MDKAEYIKRVSKGLTSELDKSKLELELLDHISINEDFYNEIGYSSDISEEKAVGCMGDSELLSEQMAMIHNKMEAKICKMLLFCITIIPLLYIVLKVRLSGAGYINDYFYSACSLLSLLIINIYSFFARKKKNIIYSAIVLISAAISIKSIFSLDTYSAILLTNHSYAYLFRIIYIIFLVPAVINCVLAICFYVKTVKLKYSKKDIKADSRQQMFTNIVIIALSIAAFVMVFLTASKMITEINNRKSDYDKACTMAYNICKENYFNNKDIHDILDEFHLEYGCPDSQPFDIVLDYDNVIFTIDECEAYPNEKSDIYPRIRVENKPITLSFSIYDEIVLYEEEIYQINFSKLIYSYLENCRKNYTNVDSENELEKMIADIEEHTNSKYVGDFASQGDSFKFSLNNGCELYIYGLPFESCVFVVDGQEYDLYYFSDNRKISDYVFNIDDVSVYYQYYGIADDDPAYYYYGIAADDYTEVKDEDSIYVSCRICIVNNTYFDLENIILKLYGMEDTIPFEWEGMRKEDILDNIIEKNSIKSSSLIYIKLSNIEEKDVFELLKQKNNDIISFSVNGNQFNVEGEWSDLS